jgi:hypothetical protein
MSKISRKRRRFEIRKKRKIREKIRKLCQRYILTKTKEEKEKIIEKALRVNPFLSQEEFLQLIKKTK